MPNLTSQLSILIKMLYDGKGAKAATKDMKGMEKQTGKTTSSFDDMQDVLTKAAIGFAVVAGAIYTAKKAFDFTREGAALNQLKESFDRMNASVFKTPDLLDRMTEASRGTIKESQLMAGLLTLTAGASDELARAMAQASPKLVEIAKAASKLNPTLGDTGFLYESLARGIKRSSPLILDNTGLVIKIGEANEKWAEKAGITVEAMSAQDKQMALLEAALVAGDKMIEQVGGSVESQADSWDRLTTSVGNLSDAFKKTSAESSQGMITSFAGMIGILADLETEQGGVTTALKLALGVQGDWFGALQRAKKETGELTKELTYNEYATKQWAKELDAATVSTEGLTEEIEKNIKAVLEQNKAGLALIETELEIIEAIKDYKAERLEEQLELEADAADELESKILKFAEGVARAKEESADLAAILKEELIQQSREYNAAMGDLFNTVIAAEGKVDDLNQRLYDQANAAGANNIALAALGVELGLFTKEEAEAALKTAVLYANIDILAQKIATGELTISGAVGALGLLQTELVNSATDAIALTIEMDIAKQALENIAGNYEILVNTRYTYSGYQGGGPPGGGGYTPPTSPPGDAVPGARGLDFTVPPGYPNDSFPIRVQSGEHVQVTPAGKSGKGASTVIVNITLQGGGNPYFIGQEVAGAVANELGNSTRG